MTSLFCNFLDCIHVSVPKQCACVITNSSAKQCDCLSHARPAPFPFPLFLFPALKSHIWVAMFNIPPLFDHKQRQRNLVLETNSDFLIPISYIFATQGRKPLIFQTINSVISNHLRFKYQRFRNWTIWVCSKDSIPLFPFLLSLHINPRAFTERYHNWYHLCSDEGIKGTIVNWTWSFLKRVIIAIIVGSYFLMPIKKSEKWNSTFR